MAKDPYKILGLTKAADKAQVRQAYRKLAKKHHPDVNPGNKAAEERFKEASAAFALLNNDEERQRYDRGEIDANGNPKGPFAHAGAARGGARNGYQGGFAPGGFDDINDILSELFGGQAGARAHQGFARSGADQQFRVAVDLVAAINGESRQIRIADGKVLKINIPAGIESGQSLRLKGQGDAGMSGGPPGDAIIEITIKPHAFYVVDGKNIRMDIPVTLNEAVQGSKIKLPTPYGPVSISIPANTSSGRVFRLKGKGMPINARSKGDLFAKVMIVLPEKPDKTLGNFVESWKTSGAESPRDCLFS